MSAEPIGTVLGQREGRYTVQTDEGEKDLTPEEYEMAFGKKVKPETEQKEAPKK